jgi:dTDP-4-dehydrorhamnose 3,5-epimerase-like enzyme
MMSKWESPHLLELGGIGSGDIGYITVVENQTKIPFDIKRVYWTYFTPNAVIRGHHAHLELQQVLVALNGKILIALESRTGEKFEFTLDSPSVGLFVPPNCWRSIQFSHTAVLMCLASQEYRESDYIRTYEKFLESCEPSRRLAGTL